MSELLKTYLLFAFVAFLIIITGVIQSWNAALFILNMGLISAVMSLGVNLQWGIAGLLNVVVSQFHTRIGWPVWVNGDEVAD